MPHTITIPGAPAIPGLSFRSFGGESDYPAMARVLEASKEADGREDVDTVEEIARDYEHLVNCDKWADMVFAEIGGEVVGYARLFYETEEDGTRVYANYGFLIPAWRRRGIGAAMLRFAEGRIREIEAARERPGPARVQLFAGDRDAGKGALFSKAGYAPVRYFFEMVRPDLEDIPDLPLPPGLEVRPFEESHYPAVWAAMQDAFRDHWNYTVPEEGEYENWVLDQKSGEAVNCGWQIAWDAASGEVAGMVLGFYLPAQNGKYGYRRGWTEEISVRRPWRKQGLASALIARSLRALKEAGMAEAALGVDAENPTGALRIYERMGFRVSKREVAYSKSL